MTTAIAALGISHSPLEGHLDPAPEVKRVHDAALGSLARWIDVFDPELVVVFGPDHYRGFFYDLMPSCCVGAGAVGLGDWHSPRGPVNVPEKIALDCVRHLHGEGYDVAFSMRMKLDHGITQPLGWLKIGLQSRPVIPVFVNCWARPLPSFRRIREIGAALGRFLGTLDRRVLVIGSGGLSHDPPVAELEGASAEVRERLVQHRDIPEEEEARVRERVMAATRAFVDGRSSIRPPDEKWDHHFMGMLAHGRLAETDTLGEGLELVAGHGAHETRTWLAAFAALEAASGHYRTELLYHRVVPEWLTGMGILRGVPVS